MNPRNLILVLSLSSIVWISVPTGAQQKSENGELLARLERMASENDSKVRNLTGAPKGRWLLHQRKVNRLIEQLKSGQPVDPKEIDQILAEHSR